MEYLLLVLTVGLGALKSIMTKLTKTKNTNLRDTTKINLISFSCALVVIFLLGIQDLGSPFSVPIWLALFYAVCTLASQLCLMKAVELGPVSISSLFYSCGFIIPTIWGNVFYQEGIHALHIVGIVLIVASFILSSQFKRGKRISIGWVFAALGGTLFSGLVGVIQKLFTNNYSAFSLNYFLYVAFAFIDNLTLSCEEITEYLKLLKLYFDSVKCTDGNNRSIIDAANRTKNSTKAERLNLRRKLCKAKFLECSSALKDSFGKQELKMKELQELRKSIREKEEQCKISKKEKVYSTLTAALDLFFNGKYTIDKDTFQIRFLGNTIGQQASHILSDGEKSIVAYCYYLATTHLLIERESDYDKLFFIIDDPISSMDFHYVYVVAQSIRDIKSTFNITTHERIWVFTHNLEFFSIVTRNHILNTAYSLKPGKIETINAKLLMPYESHLSDIVKISRKEIAPNHTTANSIRHVLETICKFEFPDKGIESYIAENPILSNDACIFSICQDLSHGGIRTQPPYTEDVLIHACDTVVAFMTEKYSGQIDAIK